LGVQRHSAIHQRALQQQADQRQHEARLLDTVTDGGSINPQTGRKRPCWNFGAASKKGLPMEGPFALKNG
jgi:hypothetical protein